MISEIVASIDDIPISSMLLSESYHREAGKKRNRTVNLNRMVLVYSLQLKRRF